MTDGELESKKPRLEDNDDDKTSNYDLSDEEDMGEVSAAPTLGSPQGSPISPLLWNIIIYGLLELPFPDDVFAQAYADDTVVVISAPNRLELEANLPSRSG
ncbi:hypothetical protein HPB49_003253 [Dermacentor silvarum]|uniref:Uncharacterized protein n=1 Tax=Dermacentor silvarum TaxID=543639 RepID=A0ACB8C0G6_DERSI|nr:hypothetical protein HPB49_003253 [Dermacentor silvarum]